MCHRLRPAMQQAAVETINLQHHLGLTRHLEYGKNEFHRIVNAIPVRGKGISLYLQLSHKASAHRRQHRHALSSGCRIHPLPHRRVVPVHPHRNQKGIAGQIKFPLKTYIYLRTGSPDHFGKMDRQGVRAGRYLQVINPIGPTTIRCQIAGRTHPNIH